MASQLKSYLINSYLVTFENSGHALFLEETEKFNSELIKFAKEGNLVSKGRYLEEFDGDSSE